MKSKCLVVLIALLVLGMAVQTADAQTRKAALTALRFSRSALEPGRSPLAPRSTSLTGDVNNMFWNPAGIAMRNESHPGIVHAQ